MERTIQAVVVSLFVLSSLGCGARGPQGAQGPAGPSGPSGPVDALQLPGASYYPESLNASADGTLYVGSLPTGEIVRFRPGTDTPEVFVAAGVTKGVTGVLPDDASSSLYACAVDVTFTTPSTVRRFDLASGAPKATFTLPAGAFCNDLAFDGQRRLYATDSTGKVLVLPTGATAFVAWSSDPLLAPSNPQGFGADGLAYDGSGAFWVTAFSDGRLIRIPINADGSAGTATQISVTPALGTPDGTRALDATTLILADGAKGLTKVSISGGSATASVIDNRLQGPTSVVKIGTDYWVAEGQLGHLFGQIPGPAQVPFWVARVTAE